MKIWKWNERGVEPLPSIHLSPNKPTIVIFGGCFNVDNPAESLNYTSPVVEGFFEHILRFVDADPQEFRQLICGTLEGKLALNYFSVRKLLGLISGVPETPRFPQTMDGLFNDEIDFLEISYSHTHECFENNFRSYKDISYISKDALECAKLLFSTIIPSFSEEATINLCRMLSHITLFGISYGSSFIIELENALCALLEGRGYSKNAQEKILGSIYTVAVSNMADFRSATGPRTSAVYFEGNNDKLAPWIDPRRIPKPLEGLSLTFKKVAGNRLLVSIPITSKAEQWIEVIPEFDYLWLDIDRAAHYTPFYTMRCLPFNIAPELIERVLRNMVCRVSRETTLASLFMEMPPFNPEVGNSAQNANKVTDIVKLSFPG